MSTFILRLSAPLQSWGNASRGSHRATAPTPTYSGLMGLLRCMQGVPKTEEVLQRMSSWRVAVRVDRPGKAVSDYHTVNPKDPEKYFFLSEKDKKKLWAVPNAEGTVWLSGATHLTTREYLSDACFTAFFEVPDADANLLSKALSAPVWAPFLGRKACLPDFPFYLGRLDIPLEKAVITTPAERADPVQDIHYLTPTFDVEGGTYSTEHYPDGITLGAGGHTFRPRQISRVQAPVVLKQDLINWTKDTLK